MKKYEIVLQNKKTKIYSTISWLIIVFNFISFLYTGISGLAKNTIFPFTGAAILLIIFILQTLYKKEKVKNKYGLLFWLIIATWLLMQFYWPAVINLLLYTLYTISTRRLIVSVSEADIIYPSFPKKAFEWSDLNNIILKDDLLTIDFKNNKLIQQLTEKLVDNINEKEFNDFCRNQLSQQI